MPEQQHFRSETVARWARVLLPIAAWGLLFYLIIWVHPLFAIPTLAPLGLKLWGGRDAHLLDICWMLVLAWRPGLSADEARAGLHALRRSSLSISGGPDDEEAA